MLVRAGMNNARRAKLTLFITNLPSRSRPYWLGLTRTSHTSYFFIPKSIRHGRGYLVGGRKNDRKQINVKKAEPLRIQCLSAKIQLNVELLASEIRERHAS